MKSDQGETAVFSAGGYRWLAGVVGFTLGATIFVGASALVLSLVSQHGGRFIGSERLVSLLGLLLFTSLVAISASVLATVSQKRCKDS